MRTPSLDKVAFVVSVAVFAFLYGIATQAFGWPPSSFVQRAWNQAEAVSPLSTDWFAGLTTDSPGDSGSPEWSTGRVYDRAGSRTSAPNRVQPGPILLTSAWEASGQWTAGLKLIDRNGHVLHEWRVNPADVFADTVTSPRGKLSNQDIQGSYLFPSGDVLVNVEYVGAARLDACSRVLWRRSANSYHHSIARAENGSFWLPGVRRDRPARSPSYPDGYPGLEGPIHHDLIVNITEEGEILQTINVLDVLFENQLERYIPHALLDRPDEDIPYGKDVLHLNDVEPLGTSLADEYPLFEAGDLVVSLRRPHLVFVFDPRTMKVKWHAHRPFIHQHDPDFIGDGWIGVFDNNHDGTERGTMLGGSRIVALQPHTDSMEVLFPTDRSDPLYTVVRGKWQLLRNGNLLLTESQAGRVVEAAPDGRTVWEWVQKPVTNSTTASVTKGTRPDVTPEQVASWPCSPGDSAAEEEESRP